MPLDNNSREYLKRLDKRKSDLFRGLNSYFESRFSPVNYSLKPIVDREGYHVLYKGVEYTFNFNINELTFELKARLPKKLEDIVETLNRNMISNTKLDKESAYLKKYEASANSGYVKVLCKLKKIPTDDKRINDLNVQLWGHIIKEVMKSIHLPKQ